MLNELSIIKKGKSGRYSSWDTTGRNSDAWYIGPGKSRVLADIKGPGAITHIRSIVHTPARINRQSEI